MAISGRQVRPFGLGCRCYAFLDAAAIALLALVIGGFALQFLRGPARARLAVPDEVTSAGPTQAAVLALFTGSPGSRKLDAPTTAC